MRVLIEERDASYTKTVLVSVEVNTLREARDVFVKARKDNELLASDYRFKTSGQVLISDNSVLATISYNGRVWARKEVGETEITLVN